MNTLPNDKMSDEKLDRLTLGNDENVKIKIERCAIDSKQLALIYELS